MQAKLCDVVGCGRPAYWVRITHIDTNHGKNLCQRCWAYLHARSEPQALCYAPKDDPEGAAFAFSSGTHTALHSAGAESDVIG